MSANVTQHRNFCFTNGKICMVSLTCFLCFNIHIYRVKFTVSEFGIFKGTANKFIHISYSSIYVHVFLVIHTFRRTAKMLKCIKIHTRVSNHIIALDRHCILCERRNTCMFRCSLLRCFAWAPISICVCRSLDSYYN